MPKSKNEKDDPVSHRIPSGGIDEPPERDVDKSTSRNDDMSESRSGDKPTRRNDDMSSSTEDDRSILRQRLDLMVEEVGVPAEKPELDTRTNARYSSAADRALRAIVNVLEDRYEGQFSKSAAIDYSVRLILRDVVENGEDSDLIRWADQIWERNR